ncbi:hypothetical protein IAR55_005583 [Kwoniella newhampshirensis]|uniref:CN hydrolase domain-containing protein n=1 Tax=Kwoniella newhampshirensis TaxID=1651941 RepID=A0AAW0YWL5_9TREE
MSQIRVALAQTCPVVAATGPAIDSDAVFEVLERNLQDAKCWVEQASQEKADVVVFPEYFLQGLVDSGRQHLITYLSHLAKEYNVSIVGTIVHSSCDGLPTTSPFDHLISSSSQTKLSEWRKFVRENPGTNHSPELRNTAFYIEAGSGKVLDEFVKRNLWHPERDYLKPGQAGHQVFDTKWGRCGFLICDIIHNHHPNPPKYENEILSTLSYARAFETETAWVMCNAGGPAEEGYIGGSGVWMPLKGKVGGHEGEQVGLKVVDVDLEVLKVSSRARNMSDFLQDARALYKIRADYDARG